MISFFGSFLFLLSIVSAYNSGINTGDGLNALRFPDVGQASVALPVTLSESLPLSFSWEAWVMYPGTVPGEPQGTTADGLYKTIVSRYTVQPDGSYNNMWADWNFQIQTGGQINFFMGNGLPTMYGILITAGTLTAGQWTHLAFSVNTPSGQATPSFATVYVDGVPSNGTWTSGTRQLISDVPIALGAYMNQDGDVKWWRGFMDEIRFWSVYRTASDVQSTMGFSLASNTPDLLAYYRCDSGNVLVDATVNGFDGEFVSGADSIQYQMSGAKLGFTVQVSQQTITTILLPGVGTNSFSYVIDSIPDSSVGSLSVNGTNLIVSSNLPFYLPSNVVVFQSTSLSSATTSFTYYGTNSGGREANDTEVVISLSAAACNPDACGVCNGDNSTCSCLPIPYNGYSYTDLQRILYLYEIDQTLDLLNQVQVQIDQAMDALSSSNYSTSADLSAEIDDLQGFNNGCLPIFDSSISQFVLDLNQMS